MKTSWNIPGGKNGSGGRNKFTLKMKRDSFKMLLMKVNKTTPVRSVLFRGTCFNRVREIHGVVSFYCAFHSAIRGNKGVQCSVCSVINVKVFNEYKGS